MIFHSYVSLPEGIHIPNPSEPSGGGPECRVESDAFSSWCPPPEPAVKLTGRWPSGKTIEKRWKNDGKNGGKLWKPMKNGGKLWRTMESYEKRWKTMENYGNL